MLLASAPRLAFAKAGLIRNELLRQRMRRASWLAMAGRDPKEAAKLLGAVAGEGWLGEVPFAHALDVAWHSVAGEPELSRRMLTASAVKHPEAALREVRQYIDLPYGMAIWEAAAEEAPDQVVALEGLSRPLLERTRSERLRGLLPLFTMAMPERQRAALSGGDAAIGDMELFGRMVDAGRRHGRRTVGARVLLTGASGLRPRDVAALAYEARTEEEREVLLQLAKRRTGEAAGFLAAQPEDLRAMLALLMESGAGGEWVTPALAARAMEGLELGDDPLGQAVQAAVIAGGLGQGAARNAAAEALEKQGGELAKLVLGRMDERRAEAKLFPAQRALATAELFPGGVCVERYFFHNDDDGVESFESFLKAYAGDPAWKIRRTAEYVHLEGTGAKGRRIEIFANIPADLQMPALAGKRDAIVARQDAVTLALRERKLEPTVIVHRGHDYHFEATRKYLRDTVRLVYLGSCRGMQAVEDVVTRCRRAQMIATRGVGTASVNDPFLKALNVGLLRGGEQLDWDEFWRGLPASVAGNEHFREYVRPYRNEAAIFLAGWYLHATGSR